MSTSVYPITTPNPFGSAIDRADLETGFAAQLIATDEISTDAYVAAIVAGATAAYPPDKAQAEAFTQAAGALSLVDTTGGAGNTDATFSTNKYKSAYTITQVDEAHGRSQTTDQTRQGSMGYKILVGAADVVLTKITKHASCTATTARLQNASKADIEAVSFSGNIAVYNRTLTAATDYYVCVDSGGSTNFASKECSGAFPNAGTNISWTGGLVGGGDSTSVGGDVVSITAGVSSTSVAAQTTIKSVALTHLNGAWTQLKLSTCGASLPAGSSLAFDIAASGTTYGLVDQLVDTWITSSQTLSGAKLRIKINAAAGAYATEPSLQGYVLQVIA